MEGGTVFAVLWSGFYNVWLLGEISGTSGGATKQKKCASNRITTFFEEHFVKSRLQANVPRIKAFLRKDLKGDIGLIGLTSLGKLFQSFGHPCVLGCMKIKIQGGGRMPVIVSWGTRRYLWQRSKEEKKKKKHAAVQLGELREVFIVFMQMYPDR